ncbi:hypothetical protein D3C73_1553600 [compost metagenome]
MSGVVEVDPQVLAVGHALNRAGVVMTAQDHEDHGVLANEAVPDLIGREVVGAREIAGVAV